MIYRFDMPREIVMEEGPFYFEIDGIKISQDIVVTTTSDWDSWSTKTATNIELNKGLHVLRLVITNGEF